ncbi:MAG: hypothetical protein K0U98_00815 [Deltaproteobacteria bacterium]|nr:hypothetical protein [Deltaproteobacteria bacterium]
MTLYERHSVASPDPSTGHTSGWTVQLGNGRRIPWQGLQTGPLTLSQIEIEETCQALLSCDLQQVGRLASQILQPATGDKAHRPALILHSTTPELKTFDGDLDALIGGRVGGDFTTYKEARSVYLARPGDVVAGRTRAWKAAVGALGAEAVELEDCDYYYLSHALLHLARNYRGGTGCALDRLVECVRETPRVVRLYAFELEMQIFLLWLARAAGLEELALEANRPALSAAWNRKSVLHPTVELATRLTGSLSGLTAPECLEKESRLCALANQLGIEVAAIPGYTIEREGRPVEDFVQQVLSAAGLLRQRYGLRTGCLKASESGDGARITPGICLEDDSALADLAREAHVHGDDYVLEAHVTYCQARVGGQTLPTALSAHIRGGQVAPGATIQFMQGTSWKGNVLLDEHSLDLFAIPAAHYRRLRRFVDDFQDAFERRAPGLVLAGIDFAIGTVGGAFGETILLGVQDLNVSFTGAECLRAFLDKAQSTKNGSGGHQYGVTRIYRPSSQADHRPCFESHALSIRGRSTPTPSHRFPAAGPWWVSPAQTPETPSPT